MKMIKEITRRSVYILLAIGLFYSLPGLVTKFSDVAAAVFVPAFERSLNNLNK